MFSVRTMVSFSVTALLLGVVACHSRQPITQRDPTFVPLDRTQLALLVSTTPLASTAHIDLINRADASGIADTAYADYTELWQRHQGDANANVWRGIAAEVYFSRATAPGSKYRISPALRGEVYSAAEQCLHTAAGKAPTSPLATLYYGDYVFWYGTSEEAHGHMVDGLALMRKAVNLDPKWYRGHMLLGHACAEYDDPASLREAQRELLTAERLAPYKSFIPWRLVRVYIDTGQYLEARRALERVRALSPPGVASQYQGDYYQSVIDKHLGKPHAAP